MKAILHGGHAWLVKWVSDKEIEKVYGGPAYGCTDYNNLIVYISNVHSESVQRETLLHELHHVTLSNILPSDEHSSDEMERLICMLSPGLFETLTRNRWLAEYLTTGGVVSS